MNSGLSAYAPSSLISSRQRPADVASEAYVTIRFPGRHSRPRFSRRLVYVSGCAHGDDELVFSIGDEQGAAYGAGSATRRVVSCSIVRSPAKGRSCIGWCARERGQSRSPEPPERITGWIVTDGIWGDVRRLTCPPVRRGRSARPDSRRRQPPPGPRRRAPWRFARRHDKPCQGDGSIAANLAPWRPLVPGS